MFSIWCVWGFVIYRYEIKCVICLTWLSIRKFCNLSNFLTLFLIHKNFSCKLCFQHTNIDFYKLNFILSYQIVILIVYHLSDNNFLLSLDHDDALNELLLAVIIQHKHNLLRMNVFPCADVIFFGFFILRLNYRNIYWKYN